MSFPPPLLVGKVARHSTWSGDGAPLLSPDRDRIEEKDRERILAMNATLQATYSVPTTAGDDFHVGAAVASEVLVDVGGWKVALTVNPRTGHLLVQARPTTACPHHRHQQYQNQQGTTATPSSPHPVPRSGAGLSAMSPSAGAAASAAQSPTPSAAAGGSAGQQPEGEIRCKLFRCCAVKGAPATMMPPAPSGGASGGGERSSRRAATVVNNPVFNNPKLRKIIGPSSPARTRRSRSRGRRKNTPTRGDTINPSSSPPPSPPPSSSPSSSLSCSPSSSASMALTRVSDELSASMDVTHLTFNALPEEVQLHVFSFLSPVDVLSIVPATCRHWKDLTQDETLWKVLQEEHFGGPRRSDRSWHQECILGLTRIKRQTQRYQTEMLLWGAKHGHTQFVRRMLREFNIDVNVRSHKSEASPLHLAAAQGHYDTIELLLSCGADVNAKTSYGRTPLERAARYGHAAVVQLLLFRGANVNSTTEGGETPLLMAAGNNHKKVVKILLHHDADVTAASAGFTALRIATLQGYTEIVQLLHKHAQQQQTGSSVPLVLSSSSLPAV